MEWYIVGTKERCIQVIIERYVEKSITGKIVLYRRKERKKYWKNNTMIFKMKERKKYSINNSIFCRMKAWKWYWGVLKCFVESKWVLNK